MVGHEPGMGWKYVAEHYQVGEQDFPVPVEAGQEMGPVQVVSRADEEVEDVGSIVTLAAAHEGFGPDYLFHGRYDYPTAQHLARTSPVYPVMVHGSHPVAHAEDHVHLALVEESLGEPLNVLYTGGEPFIPQGRQGFVHVMGDHVYVQVLDLPADARMEIEGEGAPHRIGYARFVQGLEGQAKHPGLAVRHFQGMRPLGSLLRDHAEAPSAHLAGPEPAPLAPA